MNTTLSNCKYFREIVLRSGKTESIALAEQMDWRQAILDKAVIQLPDGGILNASAIAYAKPIDPMNDKVSDSGLAYAKSLQGPLRDVAIERVTSYESIPGNGKISVYKLRDWIDSFMKNPSDFPRYKTIYEGK